MTTLLLRLVRWIAGPIRREWAEAMVAESVAAGAHSTSWALGCIAWALRDRLARERWLILSLVLIPIAAMIFTIIWFFAVAWLWRHVGLTGFAYSALMASAPLPFAYYLGTTRSRRAAMLAAPLCFFIYQSVPLIMTWVQFGTPFLGGTSIYGLPFVLGYGLGLSVWIGGAWLGSRRIAAHP